MDLNSPPLLRRRLRCDPTAPGRARDALRKVAIEQAAQDDAALVVSELVSNAVRHSGCNGRDEIELVIDRTPDGFVISVWDVGRSRTEPVPQSPGPAPGGLGLRLVESLSARWGTDREDGRRVWAEIAC